MSASRGVDRNGDTTTHGDGRTEDLHHAVRISIGARARVRHEREGAFVIRDPFRLELFLGLSDRRHFGVRVDDARNRVIIDVTALATAM